MTLEYRAILGHLKNVSIDFWAPSLNIMHGHVETTLNKNHLFGNFIVYKQSLIFERFKNIYIDFGIQLLTSKWTPAWPCTEDFE